MAHEEEALGRAYDSRLMKRLLQYLWPYWHHAILALLAIISASVLQLAQPWITKLAIDKYIATGDLAGLNTLALGFFVVLLLSFTLEYVQTWLMQMTGQRIMRDVRMEVATHLQHLDLADYDRTPVGRLMTRVTTDVDVLNEMFSSGVVAIFGDVFTLVGIMVVLTTMDWRLALLTFSVLPIIVLITQWFRRRVRESYRQVRTWIARINAFLQENVTGMSTVQVFRREARNFSAFQGINAAHRDVNIDGIFYYAVFYPAIEFVSAIATALILVIGGGWVGTGTLTLGAMVAFIQYAQRFFRPISDMSEKFNVLQSAMASSERIFGLLDTPVRISSPVVPTALAPSTTRGSIVFDHVWFAYRDESWVLRDVSFEVRPGQRVGVVGATGAGKTTIINLVLRFYDVQKGRVLVDGIDVREWPLVELRKRFGLVLQDVHLFSGTVAGNIRLGSDHIDDDAVMRAARAVHADGFIERMRDGYQTEVAERGATLSVGQKQLLSFARALAHDPGVLVLDEATSSVDTETELLIRDALRTLMAGRTTIAIAHRLSTIQDMDRILVMHRGEVREQGTHQELLALRGIYHRLYQLQYRDQERVGA